MSGTADRERLTMQLVHSLRHRDDAATVAIVRQALRDHDPTAMLITEAVMISAVARVVEASVDRVLTRRDLLIAAAIAAEAGTPLHASDLALDAGAVLGSCGQGVTLLD